MRKSALYYLFFLFLCSCAASQRTDLFFGMNIPGGGEVTNEEWKNFSDSVVAPRFPDGYTEFVTAGKWLDTETKRTISESTRVLTFVGKRGRAREVKLDTIVDTYIKRFRQQAVLRMDSGVRFKMISAK